MLAKNSSLQLLGTFCLLYHATPIPLSQPRLEELIALLAIHAGAPLDRGQVAAHFWPDSTEGQARTNTRNLLYKLKEAWPDVEQVIAIERNRITWREDSGIELDIKRFAELQALAEQSQSTEQRVSWLAEAIELYRGDFLPSGYSDWALLQREEWRGRYSEVLEALVDGLVALRRLDEALAWAKQLRSHDPLQESTYRRLMRIYAGLGDRASALRVYHNCATLLEQELGVEPSPATVEFYARLSRQDGAKQLAADTAAEEGA
ncbi:MAG: hypothetical protein HC802_23560, partial [Caldilineaceae bacterium]|nr:hypothetical protein [Caldilineaceae bacterium]